MNVRTTRRRLPAVALALCLAALAHGYASKAAGAASADAPGQVRLTITDSGMSPAEASAPAGLVHLMVENRGGADALTLRVTRDGGEVVREAAVPAGQRQWATEIDLAAGTYAVTEAAHPSWLCRLTVQ